MRISDWSSDVCSSDLNKLIINRLIVPMATLAKLPKTRPSGENKPILPGFDVHIGDLRIDRLAVAPAVTGIARSGRVEARADIASGRARVALARSSEERRVGKESVSTGRSRWWAVDKEK